MVWKKTTIRLDSGASAEAQAPEIVSASRRTDIPAFYADWFFSRLKKGYSACINPFNGVRGYVSYANTRFIVFWSKNPRPLLPHLHELEERKVGCYVQYTLNDYGDEGLERGIPSFDERVDTFRLLAERLGKGRVVWRFDPLILADVLTPERLLAKIERVGDRLHGYTEKMVFSFADIRPYRKVRAGMARSRVSCREWTESGMRDFAERLADLNMSKGWNYELAACGEKPLFKEFGILPNRCIDDRLIIRFAWHDRVLTDFLGVEIMEREAALNLFGDPATMNGNALLLDDGIHYAVWTKDNRDKGQRPLCGCTASKDIGEYGTCPHLCDYCYANAGKETVRRNYARHKDNPEGETVSGI